MVGLHVCGGNLADMAFLSKAQGCSNEKKTAPCHRQESTPCCEDETIVHEAQGFKVSHSQFNSDYLPYFDTYQKAWMIAEIIPSSFKSKIQFFNYDPPLRSADITVSLQVFLI